MDYAGVILERNDGKILFQLRDNNPNIPNPNKWGIFGGGIEYGETPKKAALRELCEELNLTLKNSQLRLLTIIPAFRKTYYIYHSKISESVSNLKLQEGNSMEYLSPKELLIRRNVVLSLRLFFIAYCLKSALRILKLRPKISKNSQW